jgi:hypothetical protein
MIRRGATSLGVAFLFLVWLDQARGQDLRVGIIDLYGLRHVTESEGHAIAGLWLLGRIGGLSEDAIQAAWSRDDRETVIDAALKRR